MPKTKFLCKYCGYRFELFIYPISDDGFKVRCPKCDDSNVQELDLKSDKDYYKGSKAFTEPEDDPWDV